VIDSPLPIPPELNHILLDSKPDWVHVSSNSEAKHFEGFPEIASLAEWHEQHELMG